MRQLWILGVALAVVLTASSNQARAGDGYGYGHGLWAWNYASAYGRMPYRTGNLPTPPYFALHPPVYYSGVIVRRSYGDSPFAYGPQRVTKVIVTQPTGSQPNPAVVENPYFESASPSDQNAPPAAPSAARMIINPYYDGPAETLAADATR